MTKFFSPAVIVMAAALASAPASHAAFADLTTFSPLTGPDGSVTSAPNFASITGTAALSGRVAGLTSFDWQFTDSIDNDGYAGFLSTSASATGGTLSVLTNLATISTNGFRTFNFAEPFTGVIRFSVDSHDRSSPGTFDLRNMVVTSAVPEPSTYAMLLAGLGLLGAVARRRSAGAGRMSAQDGQSLTTQTATAA